jgi:hypothetical protein
MKINIPEFAEAQSRAGHYTTVTAGQRSSPGEQPIDAQSVSFADFWP